MAQLMVLLLYPTLIVIVMINLPLLVTVDLGLNLPFLPPETGDLGGLKKQGILEKQRDFWNS